MPDVAQPPIPPSGSGPVPVPPQPVPEEQVAPAQLAEISARIAQLAEAVAKGKEEPKRNWLVRSLESSGKFAEHVFHIGIVVVVLLGFVYVVYEASGTSIELEEFSVNKELEESGFGPAVLAQQVKAEIRMIRESAKSAKVLPDQPTLRLSSDEATLDFEIPETKLPVKALVSMARNVVPNHYTKVTGHIIRQGPDQLAVTVRVEGDDETLHASHTDTFEVPQSDVPQLVRRVAQAALTFADPMAIGLYLAERGDPFSVDRLASIVRMSQECPSKVHQAIGALLEGIAISEKLRLMEPGKYKNSAEAYAAARTLDPNADAILVSIGVGLVDSWAQPSESIDALRSALDRNRQARKRGIGYLGLAQAFFRRAQVAPENWHNVWDYTQEAFKAPQAENETKARALALAAHVFAYEKKPKDAAAKFAEAVKTLDLGAIHVAWAEMLMAENNTSEAAAQYGQACAAQIPDEGGCVEHAYSLWRDGKGPRDIFASCWRALKAKPADSGVLTAIGSLEENVQHFAHAEADYRAAMLLSPTKFREVVPHRALYDLLTRLNRLAEARLLGRPEEEAW